MEEERERESLGYRILHLIKRLDERQEQIMGALADLQAADTNLGTEVAAVLADVVTLQAQIATLNTAAKTAVNAADLQPLIDDLNAKAASIAAALAPPAPPAPPVPPAPPAPVVP